MSTPEDAIDTSAPSSPLTAATTSPAGQAWASQFLQNHPEGVDTSGETALLQNFSANAEDARATLRAAREKLAAQRMDPSVLGLRFAQAMLSPSKGGVPDQWSKATGAVADWRQQNQDFQQQQGTNDLSLAQQLSGVDKQSLSARLALQELKERTQAQVLDTALKATAKPATSGVAESPIGKLVEDRLGAGSLKTPAGQTLFDKLQAQKPGGAASTLPPELQQAVNEGRLDPTRINSRNAPFLSQLALGNPALDFNRMHSDAALQANPTFQQKALTMETLPDILQQVDTAGQKVGYSDVRTVGKMQSWMKGEFNDPDYTTYMTKRNDALMNIASVMRGVGMSDQAHRAEIEAAAPTLNPEALHAWFNAQMDVLAPRLKATQQITHHTPSTVSSATGLALPSAADIDAELARRKGK